MLTWYKQTINKSISWFNYLSRVLMPRSFRIQWKRNKNVHPSLKSSYLMHVSLRRFHGQISYAYIYMDLFMVWSHSIFLNIMVNGLFYKTGYYKFAVHVTILVILFLLLISSQIMIVADVYLAGYQHYVYILNLSNKKYKRYVCMILCKSENM